jgi:hypothetical protein
VPPRQRPPFDEHGVDTQPSYFVFAATTSNFDSTQGGFLIDNGATNDNPNALLFVTPNVTPGGISTHITVANAIGVLYDTAVGEWEIVDDAGPGYSYSAGESFNVLVVPSSTSTAFTLTSSSSNISGDTAFINSGATNRNPSAILQVTQNLNPGGGSPVYNNSEVPGDWYFNSQWGFSTRARTPWRPEFRSTSWSAPPRARAGKP